MDFHALPRRDLQALCKRNGIRANMTNVAMADALAALPAVIDRIEEEEKEAAAEEEEGEGEMQGISLPAGPGVALTPHEVIILDDSEEEDKDLMPDLGVGRQRASRRAPVEPVSAPATRKRAAESMAETGTEAVPARTTRARSQKTVVSAPEEEAPKARRTPRKTSTEQEEEEKGTQVDVPDDCVVDSPVEERQADVKRFKDSTIFRSVTVSSEEIHHASQDTGMVPGDFTSGAAEENEVPTSAGMLQSAAKAIEEKVPVAAPAMRKRAAASMAKAAAEAMPARTTRARTQRVVVSASEEEAPKARRTPRRAVARKTSTEQEEEEKGTQGDVSDDCVVDSSVEEQQVDVQQCEDSPIFRNDTVSSEEIHHASEDTEMVPVNEVPLAMLKPGEAANEENEVPTSGGMLQSAAKAIEEKEPVAPPTTRKRAATRMAKTAAEAVPARTTRARSQRSVVSAPEEEAPKARRTSRRAVARKTSTKQEEEEKGTQCDVSDDCVVDSSVEEQQVDVQQCEDSPIFRNETVSIEEIHHASEDTEMVPVNEVSLAMLQSSEAAEEVDFTSGANEGNEVPTSGGMLQSAAAIEEKEDLAAAELTNNTDAFVEEEAAVATDEMPQRSAIVEESVIEVVTIDNLSQATVTDDEGVVKESGFTTDLTHAPIEEDAAVAADEMPLSLDESIKEEVVPIENLSQATLTDDEGVVKGSDLADVSVEEDGVVAADEMSQRSATLDESVKEEVPTFENLSQATVTDDEWVDKESAFAGDLPPVVGTARDFSDHNASPLSAGMLEFSTKSMSIDCFTVEPMVSEADDVLLHIHGKSGGQENVTEPVAVEREKEVTEGKQCEPLGSLSLRKLRIKLKEKVAVEQENEGKECKALGSISLRKLRIKLEEKVAVAQENEADDVPLCVYGSGGGKKNASEPMAAEREEEMKECNESEALGRLSLRKLRTKLKKKVAVAQENEVKVGKESKALDKLSLRKLKMKLKETLNAQKVIGELHPSMY